MSYEVHEINFILFCFLILESMESLTDNILSHEAIAHYLKSLHFQFVKLLYLDIFSYFT